MMRGVQVQATCAEQNSMGIYIPEGREERGHARAIVTVFVGVVVKVCAVEVLVLTLVLLVVV